MSNERKLFTGSKAVIRIGDKVIGEVKNIEWRKAGDPVPMDKPDYKAAALKLAQEIDFSLMRGKADFSSGPPRLFINGEAVPWPPP